MVGFKWMCGVGFVGNVIILLVMDKGYSRKGGSHVER